MPRRTTIDDEILAACLRKREKDRRILVIAKQDAKMPGDCQMRLWQCAGPVNQFSMESREVPPKCSLQLGMALRIGRMARHDMNYDVRLDIMTRLASGFIVNYVPSTRSIARSNAWW